MRLVLAFICLAVCVWGFITLAIRSVEIFGLAPLLAFYVGGVAYFLLDGVPRD